MFLLKSQPPLTTRSLRSLRSAAHFNSSALCLYYACCKRSHPFVAAAGKPCFMQRSKRCGHGVVVSRMCYVQYSDCVQDLDFKILIVLSVVQCDCRRPMNNSRDLAFSDNGLEAGLPAFQLPMFAKCDAGQRFSDMFAKESVFLCTLPEA